MRHTFPLFQSHIDLAHTFWSQIVQKGDTVIDATCGNGYDTLKLSQLALSKDKGKVYAIDIQSDAIESTRNYLNSHLNEEMISRVEYQNGCHSSFPKEVLLGSVKLVVYNLGYLPGGDKTKSSLGSTTLQSLRQAEKLIQTGGMISVTCYPGHIEGEKEQTEILAYTATLNPQQWSCCHHQWLNRNKAPSLLLMQKTINELK